jgi:hypothetical protein
VVNQLTIPVAFCPGRGKALVLSSDWESGLRYFSDSVAMILQMLEYALFRFESLFETK